MENSFVVDSTEEKLKIMFSGGGKVPTFCLRVKNKGIVMSRPPEHNKNYRYFTMRKLGLAAGFFTGGNGSSPSLSS